MKNLLLFFCSTLVSSLYAQNSISGTLMEDGSGPVMFANVVLYQSSDSTMIKVESSDEDGNFEFRNIDNGTYYVISSFVGYNDYRTENIELNGGSFDLHSINMLTSSVQLEEAVVTARRALVEVKPDRTVFNVEGTINSVGDNALGLLRKAPGVLVDNNNNISVLSRSGVLVYVDGKRLPLSGAELTSYLTNLSAEQIDRMDIITSPGAKYEAQGNAGIIDIRMKKNKGHGANGSLSGTLSRGQFTKGNLSTVGNYRNNRLNTFATLGYNNSTNFNRMFFMNNQNGLRTNENEYSENTSKGFNYRWGTDFYLGKNQTLGFLISGRNQDINSFSDNSISIAPLSNPSAVDSVLVANNKSLRSNDMVTYNLNYVFDTKESSINFDLDYGTFKNNAEYDQPNRYYNEDRTQLLSELLTEYNTPVSINIYTAKLDIEHTVAGGKLGYGGKFSKVDTDNTFLFYNLIGGESIRNDARSNNFYYDEKVYAAYANYQRSLSENLNLTAGLRVETTDATGDLQAYKVELQEDPVELDYTNLFPTAGLTYNLAHNKTLSLNYGRRINRPDYNVLNPFTVQLSELSFMKGNEKLSPEIVNNFELGYTLNYRYNFKISYSQTDNQITRLIAPDDIDPRASFLTWANLAKQTIYGFNISAPFTVNDKWDAFVNFNGGYLNNQSDYGDGAVVDVQQLTYTLFQQHTFKLPSGFTAEVSGYYSGPGVWGGVFKYDSSWSLNLGLQKKFFDDLMNVRISGDDLFYQTGWSGFSEFDGLYGEGMGNWDSRKVNLSISYNFGNSNVKSRKRKTGIEDETSRVK